MRHSIPTHIAELPIVLMRNELIFNGALDGTPLQEEVLDRMIDDICLPLLSGRLTQ